MVTISRDLSLGEIVNRIPSASRVLASFGLDFCCGGSRSLTDAAVEKGIDPDEVVAAIDRVGPGPAADWATMGPAELIDHLVSTHHAYLHAELGYLEALAEKVASVHGERHPELAAVLADVRELRADLEPHLHKEERILFPMIRRMVGGEPVPDGQPPVQAPISVMMAEHEATGDLLERLRRDSRDFDVPHDGCASYRALYEGLVRLEADTHLHVHKENNLLFPLVLAPQG